MNSSKSETNTDTSSNVVQFNSDERVLDTASEWLVKLDRGLDNSETEALKTWLATPLHRNTFLEMVALWDKMSVLSELSDIVPHTPELSVKQKAGNTISWKRPLAIAASFLVVGLLSFQGINLFSPSHQTAPAAQIASYSLQVSTKAGEHKNITLEDGSTLWLNTNSQVNIAFTDTSRIIQLVKGELHIEVAKDRRLVLHLMCNITAATLSL